MFRFFLFLTLLTIPFVVAWDNSSIIIIINYDVSSNKNEWLCVSVLCGVRIRIMGLYARDGTFVIITRFSVRPWKRERGTKRYEKLHFAAVNKCNKKSPNINIEPTIDRKYEIEIWKSEKYYSRQKQRQQKQKKSRNSKVEHVKK